MKTHLDLSKELSDCQNSEQSQMKGYLKMLSLNDINLVTPTLGASNDEKA
jgi:hypothetical protein